MNRDNKILYGFLTAIGLLFFGGLVLIYYTAPKPLPPEIRSGLFHHSYGGSICKYYTESACGVKLTGCLDEKEYHCLLNVMMELDK